MVNILPHDSQPFNIRVTIRRMAGYRLKYMAVDNNQRSVLVDRQRRQYADSMPKQANPMPSFPHAGPIQPELSDSVSAQPASPHSQSALGALNQYFGYDSFRTGQAGLVDSILAGRDVLGVMPTGAGKSICYQIPATILPGITIVISPLISLMRDQVDALNDLGIAAAYINTTQSPDEQGMVLSRAENGDIRMLYVAPERLETERFRRFSKHMPISLVTVDEAHCVSQWGQDFRSSYLGIGEFIESLPTRPVLAAFTATATERVRHDIVNLLGLRHPDVTVTGFDRPNLFFDIINMPTKSKNSWIASYALEHRDESGIVYCATRKETEGLAGELIRRGVPAAAYHGGMSAEMRNVAQRNFVTDAISVVVATNAFGMGIDKSNVRYVIHHNMPESIEAYYQEAGRAGRDGEPGRCTLLWNESDIVTRRRLMDMDMTNDRLNAQEQDLVRRSKRRLLDAMVGYCRTTSCLHRYMTDYFEDPTGADILRTAALTQATKRTTLQTIAHTGNAGIKNTGDTPIASDKQAASDTQTVSDAHNNGDTFDGKITQIDIENGNGTTNSVENSDSTADDPENIANNSPNTADQKQNAILGCGNCSNCLSTFATIDVTDIARAISRCVHDVNQSFGMGKIVAILRGSKAQDLVNRRLDQVPSYGVLGNAPEARVRDVLNQMATDGFLFISEGRLPIVCFGRRAAQTTSPDFHYEIKRVERKRAKNTGVAGGNGRFDGNVSVGDYLPDSDTALRKQSHDQDLHDDEAELFEQLRVLRRDIAKEIGKPPYIVFSDKTLRDMARIQPVTNAQFLAVNGVGDNKLRLYGKRFMERIASLCA